MAVSLSSPSFGRMFSSSNVFAAFRLDWDLCKPIIYARTDLDPRCTVAICPLSACIPSRSASSAAGFESPSAALSLPLALSMPSRSAETVSLSRRISSCSPSSSVLRIDTGVSCRLGENVELVFGERIGESGRLWYSIFDCGLPLSNCRLLDGRS